MKRRHEAAEPDQMPDSLARFKFDEWTRPHDIEGFAQREEDDVVKMGTIDERRWTFLASRARARRSAARAVWSAENGGRELPRGAAEFIKKHGL